MSSDVDQPTINGEFKKFILLFFPVLVISFSSCLYVLVEKIFLASFSTLSMEAAVNAAYAVQIIQAPCIALALMAQVYIGRWHGAKEFKKIGPGTWQLIWFSILSTIFTVPFGILYGKYFFHGTTIGEIVWPYYYCLVAINFLYPLATVLSSFFIGQGLTKLVMTLTLLTQILKIGLAYILIFGWGNWIPSLGLLGGALSTIVVQLGYCLVLFIVFLNRKNSEIFWTRKWHFQGKLFWDSIHPGCLRALNRILSLTSWASTAHLMMEKGDDFILVLSIGGTLFLFIPFFGDAICQSLTTLISQLLGSQKYHLLNKAFFSGFILVCATIVVTAIPLLVMPIETFHYLFPMAELNDSAIRNVFLGIWLCLGMFTFDYLPISYVLAFKDTPFSFFIGAMSWVNCYLLMYFFINIVQIRADYFWLCLTLMHGSTVLLYYVRMEWLKAKYIVPLRNLAAN